MSQATLHCAGNSVPIAPLTASRANWIGTLQLCSLKVAIKAYPAIVTTESRFHQVHKACGQRIGYRSCPSFGNVEISNKAALSVVWRGRCFHGGR